MALSAVQNAIAAVAAAAAADAAANGAVPREAAAAAPQANGAMVAPRVDVTSVNGRQWLQQALHETQTAGRRQQQANSKL